MNKTEKDIRLPEGFHSWLALASNLLNQDHYNFRAMNEPAQAPVFLDDQSKVYQDTRSQDTGSVIERFESDILTIKIRAFDELNAVIPSLEELLIMRNFLGMYANLSANTKIEDVPVFKLIDKLIDMKL